jgi:hypothetical protein
MPAVTAAQRPVICSSFSGACPLHRDLGDGVLDVAEIIGHQLDTSRPMFSSSLCSFVVPGIGTIHGF